MASENIDIRLIDRVDPSIITRLERIARASERGHTGLERLQRAINQTRPRGLRDVAQATERSATATDRMARAQRASSAATRQANAAQRQTAAAMRQSSAATMQARAAQQQLDAAQIASASSANRAAQAQQFLRRAIVGIGAVEVFRRSIGASIEFSRVMGEVGTLIGGARDEMDELAAAARRQAVEFGSQPIDQTRALYQIISAGAQDSATAINVLREANRLAVGGATETAVAADGLTTALNAYAASNLTAADASDTLIVGMQQGKTTIDELSRSIGRVAPLAAQAGVSFDELVGTIAAVTRQGVSTEEAITGLRQVIDSIISPTNDSRQAFEAMGIEFGSAAMESEGLVGILQQIREATGGNAEAMRLLFPNMRAAAAAAAAMSNEGRLLNEVMGEMAERAGATDEAFGIAAGETGFVFAQTMAMIRDIMLSVGDVITSTLAPGLQILVNNMWAVEAVVRIVAAQMLLAYGPSMLATVMTFVRTTAAGLMQLITAKRTVTTATGTMTVAVGRTTTAFGLLNAVMRANPIGLVVTAVALFWPQIRQATSAIYEFVTSLEFVNEILEYLGSLLTWIIDLVALASQELLGISLRAEETKNNFEGAAQATQDLGNEFDRMKDSANDAKIDLEDLGRVAGNTAREIDFEFRPVEHYIADPIRRGVDAAEVEFQRLERAAQNAAASLNQAFDFTPSFNFGVSSSPGGTLNLPSGVAPGLEEFYEPGRMSSTVTSTGALRVQRASATPTAEMRRLYEEDRELWAMIHNAQRLFRESGGNVPDHLLDQIDDELDKREKLARDQERLLEQERRNIRAREQQQREQEIFGLNSALARQMAHQGATVQMTVITQDADSFRESEHQIMMKLQNSLSR